MRKKIIISLVIAGAGILTVAGLFLLGGGLLLSVGGRSYDPANRRDLKKLSGFADDSRPFRLALEAYRYDHGRYPEAVTNLFPTYLRYTTNRPDDLSVWEGWDCEEIASNRYTLSYNLNFDEALYYIHQINSKDHWQITSYDTGYDLTLTFAGK